MAKDKKSGAKRKVLEAARQHQDKLMAAGLHVTVIDQYENSLRVLDEKGKDLTTVQFAALLTSATTFLIGGADGLDPSVKKKADLLLRLSSLTLPHALAQVVLIEQIYRAHKIIAREPYHY